MTDGEAPVGREAAGPGHRAPVPTLWWLRKRSYVAFVAREATSLAVAYAAALLLAHVMAILHGPDSHARFAARLRTWPLLLANTAALGALVHHTVTWLALTPKALVLRVRGRRVPDGALRAGGVIAWAIASLLMAWLLLGGAS